MCSWGGFLDLKNEEYVVSYLLSGQGSAPPPACYYLHLGVSVHRRQTPAAQSGAQLSPASMVDSISHVESLLLMLRREWHDNILLQEVMDFRKRM